MSLNVPGANKAPPGAHALFDWALGALLEIAPGAAWLERGEDALGPFAMLAVDGDPVALKTACIGLEASQAWARPVDRPLCPRLPGAHLPALRPAGRRLHAPKQPCA